MPEPTTTIPSVVREVVVGAPIETCFRTFVEGFDSWWPPEHHIGEGRTMAEFFIEPRVGGRCYDVDTDGGECQWGTVLAYEPPTRFVLAWHIQGDWQIDMDPAKQSELEVTFAVVTPEQTAVRLEHMKLDRHFNGEGVYQGVNSGGGWQWLLDRFSDAVEGREPRPLPTA